jgi:molecular chaperone DnaK (HSP70)
VSAKVGIDFGTTHTVVALLDRGNYPIVAFDALNAIPSLVAADGRGALRFGSAAAEVAVDPGWTVLRSFKRLLFEAGPETEVAIGERSFRLLDLLVGFFTDLRRALCEESNAGLQARDRIVAAVSVPANASSGQRFLTLEAYQRAGFEVAALVNEPSAAGFEYAHRHGRSINSKREHVLVYDLGGGTFDASLIRMDGRRNEVVSCAGLSRLGGDDFDEAILGHVLRAARHLPLGERPRAELGDECRQIKEAVGPNTRRFVVDLDALSAGIATFPIEEIFQVCQPLVDRSLATMELALHDPPRAPGEGIGLDDLAGIYVVGGASAFPPVYRALRERYGAHRVHRSPHPFGATAIGLAILLDQHAGFELQDQLTRHFGVWRDAEAGRFVSFDVLFPKGTSLPGPQDPPLEVVRRYRAAHNLGHYRFVECARVEEGKPNGEMVPWDEIRFPFESALRDRAEFDSVPVSRYDEEGPEVEERYRCFQTGLIEATLTSLADGFGRCYTLARRSPPPEAHSERRAGGKRPGRFPSHFVSER